MLFMLNIHRLHVGEIPLDTAPNVGGVIGGLIGLVTMAVLIIVVVVLSLRHHRSGSRDVETKDKEWSGTASRLTTVS